MLKYCINCLIPDSKPDISFNEHGVCKACTNFFNRKEINWDSKKGVARNFEKYKNKSQSNWDCIVPSEWRKR